MIHNTVERIENAIQAGIENAEATGATDVECRLRAAMTDMEEVREELQIEED